MPQKMWKHTCSKGGLCWIGAPVCPTCGVAGEYDELLQAEAHGPSPDDGR